MTASSLAKSGSAHAAAGSSSAGLFHRVNRAWDNFRAYRATLIELKALTDRQLADLGLARGSIRTVARHAVYGN